MGRRTFYIILTVSLLFLAAQCGNKGGDTAPASAPTTADATAPAAPPATPTAPAGPAPCANQCVWDTSSPQILNTAYPAGAPAVAMNANGDAMAIWAEGAGNTRDIYFNLQTQFGIWGTAARTLTGYTLSPEIVMDAAGNTILTFLQTQTGLDYFLYGKRY